ncbi:hypothetical protein AB0B63_20250, partial [Micromonospora sp. NPDC049081]|uniref:hypothetical protein n=1 Tax=Micromonospora sp. NPDC049081 TaxID=3155150 RepID=UPI0033FBA7B4
MSVLANRVNADPALAAIPIHSDEACNQVGGMPVLATPATIVTVAAGVGLVGTGQRLRRDRPGDRRRHAGGRADHLLAHPDLR